MTIALQHRLWLGESNVNDAELLRQQVAMQKLQNSLMAKKNQRLRTEVMDLKGGHQVIEAHARTRLGMISQGEVFYQIVRQVD